MKYNIRLTKLKKIHELIKDSFDINITDINEAAFISDVKNYISKNLNLMDMKEYLP